MDIAPLAPDELERLAALRALHILDSEREDSFDELVRFAADLCGTPIAAISLVDEHRQWFKSEIGLGVSETSRDVSFCAHTILGADVFTVADARTDARFADNPLVIDDPSIGFYAGAPLHTTDGHRVGALCVIDHEPRVLTEQQRSGLRLLARIVERDLESRRWAGRLAASQDARAEAERQALLDAARWRMLSEISAMANAARDLNTAAATAMSMICQATPWTFAELWSVDDHGNLSASGVTFDHHADHGGRDTQRPRLAHPAGAAVEAAASRAAVWVADLEEPSVRRERPGPRTRSDLRASVAVPITVADRLYGVIELFAPEPRQLDEAEVAVVVTAADQLGHVAARAEARAEVSASDSRFRSAFDNTGAGMAVTDLEGRYLRVNPTMCTLTGYRSDELLARSMWSLAHPEDLGAARAAMAGLHDPNGEGRFSIEMRFVDRSGAIRWVLLSGSTVPDDTGAPDFVVTQMVDISERRRIESELREAREEFEAAFDHAPIGMALVSAEGRFLRANPALGLITGYTPAQLTATTVQSVTHPDDLDTDLDMKRRVLTGELGGYELEHRLVRPDGSLIWIAQSVSPIHGADGVVRQLICQIQDITERRLAADELAHQATHDALTGLANRVLFGERLELASARFSRHHQPYAVLFVDLDGFKGINDRYGHDVGDQVLRDVAGRLTAALRPGDAAGRLGGDEFVALCEELASPDEAATIAERVRDILEGPYVINGQTIRAGASVGLAWCEEQVRPTEAIARADAAMYEDKAGSKRRAVRAAR